MTTYTIPVVAVINGQRLLIDGNGDGSVYALKARTGEVVWKFELSKLGLNASVAVDGTRVYASMRNENIDEGSMGRVVCIDGTGVGDVTRTHEIWRANEIKAGYASPLIHDGKVYVIDDSGNMHALDADTGETRWEYSLGTVGKGSPVWADGKIFTTEVNGNFHIIKDGDDGAESLDVEHLAIRAPGDAGRPLCRDLRLAGDRIRPHLRNDGGGVLLHRRQEGRFLPHPG
jgi:outer membrane protein assembly factor BamB